MRLHRLSMTAFGPFADETAIDFDDLSGDGLFLLHGPTGAGKTSVLDAVAFALFGRVPGARHDARRLHSDHAAPESVPEVMLEATIAGRRLRITRSPDHHRPKKRGAGTTKVNARATLVYLDGSGPDLTRLVDIGEAVTRLLGMSADQFFQVVLLPQGEFARFLRANSDEREELLERLFDTERFGDLEDWLRDRARESASALGERTSVLDRIAGQIVALGGVAAPADPDMDWAQGCLESARAEAVRLHDDVTSAQAALDRAQAAHEEGGRLVELRRRGDEARSRLDRLAAGAENVARAADSLAAARRAAPVIVVADELDRATAACSAAARGASAARTALGELPEGAALCDADPDELSTAIERWTAESGRWEPLARRAEQRPELVAAVERMEAEIGVAEKAIDELRVGLDAAPGRREDAVRALDAAVEARAQVLRLQAERDRVAAIGVALADRVTVTTALAETDTRLLSARESHASAREHHLDVRERRLAGMAAELAGQLEDGMPCGVCGSRAHPEPAAGGAEAVGKDDEEAAARAEHRAAADRTREENARATLVERRAHLDVTIGTMTDDQFDAERTQLAAKLEAAQRSAERVPELSDTITAIDAETEKLRGRLTENRSLLAARRERVEGLREDVATLDAEIAEATGGRIGVAERRAELGDLCRRATTLRTAREEEAQSRSRRADIRGQLEERSVAADFVDSAGRADVDAVRMAAASRAQIADWEALIQRAAAARAGADETLADPAVAAACAAEAVDLPALAAGLTDARATRDDVAGRHAVVAARVGGLEDYVAQFWAAADGLAPARARHEELQGLAELVAGRGQNSRRMALRSYVLAARLEEVLVAASARLHQMSAGRYEFVHSDAAGIRGRRGGLGIEVRDEYTGAVRATTTLSGGETFFASLALALGLADVVSAEAGGRILDTIFIDEGFGTLDPDALDLVMRVLDDLRAGGRVVGVVSHVDELRARIPAQLEVLRGEAGSRVHLHGPVGVS
ncbi:AAA family ATPase [Gordonia insulae]|uniref:Nuclease SbcCD subunit C n=1 Tax=Gordonia insulae TaxID=2420509 RepID=A0A3G8JIE2_9ACTN|nr:SMC family ATPase [Gordonia insulae]AZG44773.1 Nuclease SbcCD subunit C [Gordonia insulae]